MKVFQSKMKIIVPIIMIVPILMIAGCKEPGREDGVEVRFTLVMEKIESRDQDNETVWDAFITIDDIDPYDMEYKWVLISISVSIGDHIDISGASPYEYENKPSRFGTVSVWRDDFSGNPETADPTDYIVLTSLKEEYEGARLEISFKSDRSGHIYLPDEFTIS